MICPKCKYEYRPEITKCPDCDEYLVTHIVETAAAEVPDESWTPVYKFDSGMSADLVKGALDSNNIPSIIISNTMHAINPGFMTHGDPVRDVFDNLDSGAGILSSNFGTNLLMVPKEFKPEAILVLQAVLGDDYKELYI